MVLFSSIEIAIHAFKNMCLFHICLFHEGLIFILMCVLGKLEFSFLKAAWSIKKFIVAHESKFLAFFLDFRQSWILFQIERVGKQTFWPFPRLSF